VKFSHVFSWFARGLLVAVLASAVLARAEPTTFSTSLSPEDKAVTGIARLTEAQVASLDQQVQHEIATAHQGNTVAFSTSFTHRRTPQQRLEAGLDHLMTPELAQLDRLVAAALANRTPPAGPLVTTPATTSSSPNSYVETVTPKLEIHGEVSFSYVSASGGGHGYTPADFMAGAAARIAFTMLW